ncbi:hypothetical protein [Inconstantimicrobium mannanitabidum]|uniref:Uncharacterized protein n=1 Tax=Inconstantimicrobium mannanitabidum TaxID=1604901 RepID=A0ACB5RDK3_9CLOT|nr:hypothetical protein [Clostridium sp. TW13]GKX67342.1 hypothetical protein rsdtw13_26000 [Clostridium sp. TW13]
MAKNKRGKAIKKILNWRGTCPICKRTRVKLLWEKDGQKVCKICGNK